jgi:hypothetical protein
MNVNCWRGRSALGESIYPVWPGPHSERESRSSSILGMRCERVRKVRSAEARPSIACPHTLHGHSNSITMGENSRGRITRLLESVENHEANSGAARPATSGRSR